MLAFATLPCLDNAGWLLRFRPSLRGSTEYLTPLQEHADKPATESICATIMICRNVGRADTSLIRDLHVLVSHQTRVNLVRLDKIVILRLHMCDKGETVQARLNILYHFR